jgi:hypothetical protein
MAPAQQVRHADVSSQNCERVHTHRTHSTSQQETRDAQVIAERTRVHSAKYPRLQSRQLRNPCAGRKSPSSARQRPGRGAARAGWRAGRGKERPGLRRGKRLPCFKENEVRSSSSPLSPVNARGRYGTPGSRRSRRVQVNGRARVRWRNTCVALAASAPEARQHFPRATGRAIARSPCGDWPHG